MKSKAGNESINTFSGGMNLDIDPSLSKPNQYRYAENIRISQDSDGTLGAIIPLERYNLESDSFFDLGSTIIDTVTVRDFSVVIAKNTISQVDYTQIYKLYLSGQDVVSLKIVEFEYNIPNKISMVSRYEDDDNIKVYWADGVSPIRVVNISATYQSGLSADDFNIIPTSNLSKPSLMAISSGGLLSGRYQYYYQLYNKSGASSSMSPGSNMIDISPEIGIGGAISETYGEPANKSIKVHIPISAISNFSGIKLYSIYYYNYNEAPIVSLVKDIDIINKTIGYIDIIDYGNSTLAEYTIDEFNLISSSNFNPKYIESKDNILFAANLKENSFNIDYDTRSFQFKKRYSGDLSIPIVSVYSALLTTPSDISDLVVGSILKTISNGVDTLDVSSQNIYVLDILQDTTSWIFISKNISVPFSFDITPPATNTFTFTASIDYNATLLQDISGVDTEYEYSELNTIPEKHDCMHYEIYDKEKFSELEYIYDNNGNIGGAGVNVDYLFANSFLIGAGVGDKYDNESSTGILYNSAVNKYIDDRTIKVGHKDIDINLLQVLESDGSQIKNITIDQFGINGDLSGQLNYSNPFISSALCSYKRDEIYRFAAVFYDANDKKSDAKWIADIRFPSSYYRDDNWTSSIFEMPEEVDAFYGNQVNQSPIDVNRLSRQELLLKPLGLKFTFKNLDTSIIKKIEIVRAKRDINNRTVYAQGVLGKIGTKYRFISDAVAAENKYYDISGYGTLRPHPILSMSYGYSLAPIYANNSTETDITYDKYSSLDPVNRTYVSHSLAPFHADKNYLSFISPEISYYGVDYVEQLRHVVKSPKISIQDILYPKTTPSTLSDPSTGVPLTEYIGSDRHNRLFNMPSGIKYPSAIYCAADLTRSIIANELSDGVKTFFSHGLAGVNKELSASDSESNYNSIGRSYLTSLASQSLNDVFIDTSKFAGDYSELYPRAFISTGGVMSNYGVNFMYKHGIREDVVLSDSGDKADLPAVLDITGQNNRSEKLNMTFKYYCNYNKKLNILSTFGGEQISTITQTGYSHDAFTSETLYSIGDFNTYSVNSYEYSGDVESGIAHWNVAEYTPIGEKNYINWSKCLTSADQTGSSTNPNASISRGQSSGRHGSSMLLYFNDNDVVPSISSITSDRRKYSDDKKYAYSFDNISKYSIIDKYVTSSLATYLVDLKKMNIGIYGGPSYVDRQFTEYISTGAVIDVEAASESKYIFGGDTYINMFDYTITRASDPMVESYASLPNDDDKRDSCDANILSQVKRVGAMIPMESSINIDIERGKPYVKDGNNFVINKTPGEISTAISAGGTWKKSQLNPEHEYNSAYSANQTAKVFLSKLISSEDNKTYDCRIFASDPKSNDELYDSWASFRPANYIDVDSEFGEITRIKKHKDRLMFWQENGFGIVAVNDRSLITDGDGAELSLGTGGVLSRYDYISTICGLNKSTIKGLESFESGVYWYDKTRNNIYRFSNGLDLLSKSKSIQSALNINKDYIGDFISIGANSKYGDIVFNIEGLSSIGNLQVQ